MAVAIAATVQGTWPPRVLVSVTGLTVGDAIELHRVVDGQRSLVRAGAVAAVTDTSFLRNDAELPFGRPVAYVAVVNGSSEYTTVAATYQLPGGRVAISDAISGAAAEVWILSGVDPSYERRASVFAVGGRSVVVSGDWGMYSGDLEVITETTAGRDTLHALLAQATEGVVQVRQPGGYDGVDAYLAVLGAGERRLSPRSGTDPRRIITLRVVQVEGWAPALEARGTTLQDIATVYDVPGPVLNANPYIEATATGWTALGGTVARSTSQAHEGAASLLLTPDGVSATVQARAENLPATVGVLYQGSAWVRCAVARTLQISIIWRDAASAIVGTSPGPLVAVAAGTWTYLEVLASAPAGATQAMLAPASLGGTPPVGHTTHIDEAVLRRAPLPLSELAADYPTLLAIAQAEFA
ncbi:hypothetical protein AB0N38_10495 [Micromonospora aurantiaca]|uniref:hypothetical protein n=1 Tax=Micromonospora aurantiaca (nom. illeg.) TaxID=47850 RepID=UPI00341B948D